MPLSTYAQKLRLFFERYDTTATEILARIATNKLARHGLSTYLTELAAKEILAPGSFAGTSNDDRVALSWSAATNATGYIVQRSNHPHFLKDVITVYTGSGTSYTDTGLTQNTLYYYRVTGTASGYDGVHAKGAFSTLTILTAPATFTITNLDDTNLDLTWAAVSGATGYVVERATASNFSTGLTTIYTGNLLTFVDTSLTPATQYWYRVHATASAHNVVTYTSITTTTAAALAAPATLTFTSVAATTLTVNWAAVTNATGYILERATNSGFSAGLTTIYTGANVTFNDTGLTTATPYWYRVHATKSGFTTVTYRTATQTTN